MPLETMPFDAARYFTTEADQTELLADALKTGEAGYIAAALGTIARAQGMTKVAQDAGVTREALYRSLSKDGDPRLSTILGVLKSLGLQLSVQTLR
jgi:probable addiction module antidote protein